MNREIINPPSLYETVSFGFSHAAVHSGRTAELAGQVAWNAERDIIGAGDLEAQTRQVLDNLRQVLAAVGAGPQNVVRLRTYVVDHSPEKLGPICGAIAAFYDGHPPAPNTFIGVQALALPDFLIEIEATAVIGE